jgi:hypothetical protein
MKIKFLDAAMLGNKVYVKGDEAEIPDITAGELINKTAASIDGLITMPCMAILVLR